jgi:NAD(P)-dependent dehydrogenase (short-subunit alcohol dehydrogenase family)
MGMKLTLIDRDEKGLASIGQEIGRGARTIVCDLSQPDARRGAGQEIANNNSIDDGLIHNAAIDPRMPIDEMSLEFFRDVIATNVEPAVELTRELLPNLRRSGRGRVITIGSITFATGPALLSAYVAAKGAVVGLTRSLAHELGPDGITVNCISPGAIQVEKEAIQYSRAVEKAILAWQSVKRRLTPNDLLGLVCLLLSEAGGAISGQLIGVDGGFQHPIADADLQRPMIAANKL